jgi:hypothetical protein
MVLVVSRLAVDGPGWLLSIFQVVEDGSGWAVDGCGWLGMSLVGCGWL